MYLILLICIFSVFVLYSWIKTLENNKQSVFYLAICIVCSILSFEVGKENLLPIQITENTHNLTEIQSINKERISFLENVIYEYKNDETKIKK